MRTLLFGLVLLAGVGCTGVQPVGPLARASKRGPLPAGGKDATPPDPVTVAAPRPVPPAMLITPAEVAADTPEVAAQKLMAEIDTDRKSLQTTSKTAEVSHYVGGVKVR